MPGRVFSRNIKRVSSARARVVSVELLCAHCNRVFAHYRRGKVEISKGDASYGYTVEETNKGNYLYSCGRCKGRTLLRIDRLKVFAGNIKWLHKARGPKNKPKLTPETE
jgi:hypothetical protein